MTELLTAAQMRAIEEAAIASGEVTGLDLMERAGRGVVEAIFEEWPELRATSHRAVVLCGPGNNGGDGFVVARLLKDWGWEVEVFLYGDPEQMPPDARVNYERWVGMGEVRQDLCAIATLTVDLLVDALFGTGLSRPVASDLYDVFDGAVDRLRFAGPERIVAVDTPSGLCTDSGIPLDVFPRRALPVLAAKLTVTFHLEKVGHYLDYAPYYCGKVRCKGIGIPHLRASQRLEAGEEVEWPPEGHVARLEPSDRVEFDVLRVMKDPPDHKYSHGHALIISGSHGRSGAARLAARGALRIGAGVVTVASPRDAMAENAARLDAIMLREVAGAEGLAGVLEDRRINALCLGPGMGTGEGQADLLAVALAPPPPAPPHGGKGRRLVLDADALTILSQRADLFATLHEGCVLTPHAGEFARLFPDIAEKLAAPATKGPAYSKVDATREAAARAGCVVLYKGPDTVIADPTGRAAINAAVYDRAAPWLATAGSGDVLAGFITGLLARGFSPFDAACTGAWLHVECARSFGAGLIAEDLPEELPKVLRALGL